MCLQGADPGMLPGARRGSPGWEKREPSGSAAWQPLLALTGLWVRDLPAGLQSWIAVAGRQSPVFAASMTDTGDRKIPTLENKWRKG